MNESYCDQCGAGIEPNDGFCTKCGAPVVKNSPPTESAIEKKEAPPQDDQEQTSVSNSQKSGLSRLLTFVAGGILVLSGIIFLALSPYKLAWLSDSAQADPPLPGNREQPIKPSTDKSTVEADETIVDKQPKPDQQAPPEKEKPAIELLEVDLHQTGKQPDPLRKSQNPPNDPPAVRVTLPPGQFGTWSIEASSLLPPSKNLAYGPVNIVEGGTAGRLPQTAWVEGKQGDGTGEWIQFIFGEADNSLTFSSLTIVNGYAKTPDIFQKNSRVKQLQISYSEGVERIQLLDTDSPQTVRLKSPVQTHWIRLTIESVYPGTAYKDTAISWVSFDNEDFNYYPPLEGRSIPSPDGELLGWVVPKRSGSSGRSEALVQIWKPAASGNGTMPEAVGAYDHSSESGSHGRIVDHAGWTANSRFFVYTTSSSGGHSPWHAMGFFFDRTTGRVASLADYGIVILQGKIAFSAPSSLIATVQQEPGDLDGSKVKIDLTKLQN